MSRRTRRGDRQQQQPPARSTTVSNNPIFFVDDGVDDVPGEFAKPLPLPPSRAHLQPVGSRRAASSSSTFMASRHGSGWVLRRVDYHDPFLAAYVACTKSGGGGKVDAAPAKGQQKKNKNRGDAAVQGCGIWSGWTAAGARYAGAMSCKYGCDVATAQGDDPVASPAPRLHLSRQLVVIPARKRALQPRGRAQG